MNPVWIIQKKRDRGELSAEEIGSFISRYAAGEVPDYQMSALAMAIYLNGMTTEETAALTDHMLASGARFEWPGDGIARVDKHSTGGVGDKTSLPLAAMLACCGVQVPMISGRGLGATGGTLDKLESIPGFRTDLSMEEIRRVVADVGCVITGATPDLVPADRKLYALRDVTATVPSIPLITASIMSKKLAEGLDALVLDVKFGSGAFMKTEAQARELAESLVATGKRMGVGTTALLTDMNQPLGRMVGNAVEVNESLAALEGRGPADLMEVTLALGAEVLASARGVQNPPPSKGGARGGISEGASEAKSTTAIGLTENPSPQGSGMHAAARAELQRTIDSGAAREKFAQMVAAQGGDIDAPRAVAPASELVSDRTGYLASIDAERLGHAIIALRGGRQQLGDQLDHSTGIEMLARVGDPIERGQPMVRMFAPRSTAEEARRMLADAMEISDQRPVVGSLILERIA